MKFIKIFLASSINEFAQQRLEMEAYINQLNNIYISKGLFFQLIVCEGLSNAVAMERKQEEYNREIRDSQFFYVLFGKEAGEYTIEEFDVALNAFRENGAPRIYTYFQGIAEEEQGESVKRFMSRLDQELGHYYSYFEHLDSIKLNLLLELARHSELEADLKFEEGKAKVNGKEVLSLERVPIYANNEELQNWKKELQEVQYQLAELAAEYAKQPGELSVRERLSEKSQRYNELMELISGTEGQMLKLCSMIAERDSSGKPMTWREKEASRMLSAGDYKGALSVLRLADRKKDVERLKNRAEQLKQEASALIHETRLRVQTLFVEGINAETLEECMSCYEEATQLAGEYGVEINIFREYADFLLVHHKIRRGIEVAEQLEKYYEQNIPGNEELWSLYRLLGNLHYEENNLKEAEMFFRRTLELAKEIAAEEQTEINQERLSTVYNSLASVSMHLNKPEEAQELWKTAIELQKGLSNQEDVGVLLGLADLYNNLAVLQKQQGHFLESEENYRFAMDVYRQIKERFPDVPEVMDEELALASYNLANLFCDQQRYEEAENLYRQGIAFFEHAAVENPAAYEPWEMTLKASLATLLMENGRNQEAEELLKIAMDAYAVYAEENVKASGPDFTKICFTYANLQWNYKKRYGEARKTYRTIISVYSKLAEENPEQFEPEIAFTRRLLADMFCEQRQYARAETEYLEAMKLYERWKESNLAAYEPPIGEISYALSVIAIMEHGNRTVSRRHLEKALPICKKYPQLSGLEKEIERILAENFS